jgi:hypothetical protein
VSLEHSPARAQEKLLTRRQLAEFLTENGFPISPSTLAKLAMPSSPAKGPPDEGLWGNRKLHSPTKALEWARERFRSSARD